METSDVERKVIELLRHEPTGMLRSDIAFRVGTEHNAILTKVLFDLIDKGVVVCLPQFAKDEHGVTLKSWYMRGKNWDTYIEEMLCERFV